jgi:hypothetical protein
MLVMLVVIGHVHPCNPAISKLRLVVGTMHAQFILRPLNLHTCHHDSILSQLGMGRAVVRSSSALDPPRSFLRVDENRQGGCVPPNQRPSGGCRRGQDCTANRGVYLGGFAKLSLENSVASVQLHITTMSTMDVGSINATALGEAMLAVIASLPK